MAVFTKKVDLVWMVDYAKNYQFDRKGNCYNIKTSKQLKRAVVGYTEGYCIKSKFKSLKYIRKHLVKIKKVDCPF
jgi:hypothetical protein